MSTVPESIAAPASRETRAWVERAPLSLRIAKAALLTVVVVSVVFPFVSVVATSFASDEDILRAGGYVIIPGSPTSTPIERFSRMRS